MTAPGIIELVERLEKATGPDRELDTDIWFEIGWEGQGDEAPAPCLTASVDAALALIERTLPGVFWLIAKGRTRADEPLYAAELLFGTDEKLGVAEHNDLCCAICLALLRALPTIEGEEQ